MPRHQHRDRLRGLHRLPRRRIPEGGREPGEDRRDHRRGHHDGRRTGRPNLADYDRARAEFTWAAARRELDGLPGGAGLNIAHEAVDRHALGPLAAKTALRFLRKDGRVEAMTYGELRAASSRFANVLRSLGVGAGDRVFALAGRIPALYVAALGTLKNRSVFTPLLWSTGCGARSSRSGPDGGIRLTRRENSRTSRRIS